ncbi:ubiquitin-conjugating enzyme E2 J1 isoform X2 [Phyllopteryx taeniolatus]|uniref:ubiquitin-conjugating enzyme E2 J1 isoform X2 n=1 Tax=Phyllopteryx taeniolatus TaxID=161469 RepID=UPI002AD2E4AB|nr:ubiquitin-conjugating enzyme E2 J1 isoform X2 [Phyllopteryx taeniolatus]
MCKPVKRLMKEAAELRDPTEHYHAQPLEDNLFEWHFSVRGPPDSDFDGGVYHGRIVLPPEYPMKPPSIILLTFVHPPPTIPTHRFLTSTPHTQPNGRFEVGKKICLSISGHHPETWQPSWSSPRISAARRVTVHCARRSELCPPTATSAQRTAWQMNSHNKLTSRQSQVHPVNEQARARAERWRFPILTRKVPQILQAAKLLMGPCLSRQKCQQPPERRGPKLFCPPTAVILAVPGTVVSNRPNETTGKPRTDRPSLHGFTRHQMIATQAQPCSLWCSLWPWLHLFSEGFTWLMSTSLIMSCDRIVSLAKSALRHHEQLHFHQSFSTHWNIWLSLSSLALDPITSMRIPLTAASAVSFFYSVNFCSAPRFLERLRSHE